MAETPDPETWLATLDGGEASATAELERLAGGALDDTDATTAAELKLLAGGAAAALEEAGELATAEEPAAGVEPSTEHPDLATSWAGQSTFSKSTVGLLAPFIQSQRKSQPG